MSRTPLRTLSFLALLSLAAVMCSSGLYMWNVSASSAREFEGAFSTIATVRQSEDGVAQKPRWRADRGSYSYVREYAYNLALPAACCQGFFNRAHRKFAKQPFLIFDNFSSLFLCSQKNILDFRADL
jgi:hypothetical protein